MCEKSGVHTKFVPDYNKVIPSRAYTEDIQGLPVVNIRRVPLNDPLNRWMKPVSYTHLDVYKRQIQGLHKFTSKNDRVSDHARRYSGCRSGRPGQVPDL